MSLATQTVPVALTGRIAENSMNQSTPPEELPAGVLDDVASVVGAEVTLLGRRERHAGD